MFSLSSALTGKTSSINVLLNSQFIKISLVEDNKDDSAFGESSSFSFFTAISDMADK